MPSESKKVTFPCSVGSRSSSTVFSQFFPFVAITRFWGVSPSLVYAYVERKQIPHYRMMGRSIRFRLAELVEWRQQFHVNGGIDEQQDR